MPRKVPSAWGCLTQDCCVLGKPERVHELAVTGWCVSVLAELRGPERQAASRGPLGLCWSKRRVI